MNSVDKIKNELKTWVYYGALEIASKRNIQLTFEDINSVLLDILHENNQHDPKEQFKKQ